ncbi:MAG: hypothetical protein LBI79_08485 [Nitrososphaerota archaeon]|jgi:DNA-damage-inducible protein D|nr:hypothetical protein [Nitrososphaerota archaeon]
MKTELKWYAGDLQKVLRYAKWENFSKAIDRAMLACKNSGFNGGIILLTVTK